MGRVLNTDNVDDATSAGMKNLLIQMQQVPFFLKKKISYPRISLVRRCKTHLII